jgi:hypothetical protein
MNRFILALFVIFGAVGAYAQDTTPPIYVPPMPPAGPVADPVPGGPMTTPVDDQTAGPADAQCATRDDTSSICINDRVIDNNNQPGMLMNIYDDMSGTVTYENGTVNDAIDLQNVAREVQCLYGFCIGDRARDDEGYVGTITDIFENGVAELTYPNGEVWYINLDELDPVQDDGVIITHPWPDPRPYPDTRYYGNCVFPRRPIVIFQVGRRLGPVFPIPPRRIGWHPVPNYPYHPVRYPPRPAIQRPGFPNGNHPNFPPRRPGNGPVIGGPRPGNGPVTGGPRPGPGPRPGNGPVIGGPRPGNNGPRPGPVPGNNGPRPFPGNNGPRPGPVPGNNGPRPFPGNNGPRPGPVPGNNGPRPGNNNPGPGRPNNPPPRPSNPGNNGGGRPAPSRPSGGGMGPSRPAPSRPSGPPPSRPSGGGGGGGVKGPSPSKGPGGGGPRRP